MRPDLEAFDAPNQPSSSTQGQQGPVSSLAFGMSSFQSNNDWTLDNLDEIVAIAIKTEFNAFDLADLPDDPQIVKDELQVRILFSSLNCPEKCFFTFEKIGL